MPTLSVFRRDFMKIGKWLGIFLAVIILIFILIKLFGIIKNIVAPAPPPLPTVTFGKLPTIYYPEGIKKSFSYSVDTISGDLPNFPSTVKVFKMDQSKPDILAVQKATQKIQSLGFDPTPIQLSDITYQWRDPESPYRNLILNVNISQFNLYSLYITDPDITEALHLPTQADAITTAQQFIINLGLFPDDIDSEKTLVKTFNIQNGLIIPSTSISNTKLFSIYFFQKDKDSLPIVYPGGATSSMNITVGSSNSTGGQVVDGKFFYQKSTNESATYPIISATEALDRLKKGNAYIADYNGGDQTKVVIKKVYLAYYSEGRTQAALLPVVVFEGDNGFIAYVTAVKDEWINK